MAPSVKENPSRILQSRLAGIETALPPAPAAGPWPTEVLFFTQLPAAEAEALMAEGARAMLAGDAPGHRLAVAEHPEECGTRNAECGIRWEEEESPGGAGLPHSGMILGPGVLTARLAMHLRHWGGDAVALRAALAGLGLRVLADFGIEAGTDAEGGLIAHGKRIGDFGSSIEAGIARAWLQLDTNSDSRDPARTSMAALGMRLERQSEVRSKLVEHYEASFGSRALIPQRTTRGAKPPWLRVKLPLTPATRPVHDIMRERGLHTVCESARCPNQGECWAHGTATFMINGDVCTRSCSFCAVFTGRPKPLDANEPRRVAEAARLMGLKYVVVTAVNRDELADGGAGQFAATIAELRRAIEGVKIEVLIPDFKGNAAALEAVFAAGPDVLNHNVETVPRLYSRVRPQADFRQSLAVLARAAAAGMKTKSGFMLGLGEEEEEIAELLRQMRGAEVKIATIGQYLRPSEFHHPVVRYATPGEFAHWRDHGLGLGFEVVQSGALVRSSYHAHESFAQTDSQA